MRKNTIKSRVIAVGLLAAMAANPLAVLGEENEATNENSQNEEMEQGDVPIGMQKYDSLVTISTALGSSDALERMLAETEAGETLEENRYTRWYEEALNIDVQYDWIAKDEAYYTKLNLSISSGNISDIMLVDANQAKMLYEAGKIQPLTEVYEQYATDMTKKKLGGDAASDQLFDAVSFDGELYAIPRMISSYDMGQYLWVRADWLEKYNLPEPNTMEDVITIAKTLAAEDPDGNGVKDTVGLGLVSDPGSGVGGITGFLNGYHAYWGYWIGEEGNLEYSTFAPEVKTALAALQDLYQAGAISKEYTTTDYPALCELMVSGKCGLVYGQHWIPLTVLQESYNYDSADWVSYPLPSCDDTPACTQMSAGTSQFWVISKDCDYPEALIKMINLQYTIPETEWPDYVIKTDISSPASLNPFYVQSPLGNIDVLNDIRAQLNGDTPENIAVTGSWLKDFAAYKEGNDALLYVDKIFNPDKSSVQIMNDVYIEENRIQLNQYIGASTQSMIDYGSTLGKMINEELIRIIAEGEDVSEWDKLKEEWLSAGGQKILDEINVK